VYNEGLARFATEPYEPPCKRNLHNVNMHLTNYAINKRSRQFNSDETSGHKRRITTIWKRLEEEGENVDTIRGKIDDIIIKTIITIHPNL
jgi:tubulin polyglutamylase TTLL6/13